MKRTLLLLAIISGSLACDRKTTYDYQVIDSDIIVGMTETLGTPTRSFKLNFLIDKPYGCMNYSIITKSEISDNKINIEFPGIYTPVKVLEILCQ